MTAPADAATHLLRYVEIEMSRGNVKAIISFAHLVPILETLIELNDRHEELERENKRLKTQLTGLRRTIRNRK